VEGVTIPQLIAQSPAVVLAVLVWVELRAMRGAMINLSNAIAVLADRNVRP
jgi:hypothetical protein